MTVSSDAFLDTDDLDALVERVLAEGEASGLVPRCVGVRRRDRGPPVGRADVRGDV
jgi:hypothetical protein